MNNHKNTFFGILLAGLGLIFFSSVYASEASENYADKIQIKALSGLANIGTGFLEIPKNTINTSNDSNIIWGLSAGLAKGVLFAGGRILSGIADLVTFPFATTPITYPVYIWDDVDVETRFGDAARFTDRPRRNAYMP